MKTDSVTYFYKGEVGDAASRFNELLEINEYNGTFFETY